MRPSGDGTLRETFQRAGDSITDEKLRAATEGRPARMRAMKDANAAQVLPGKRAVDNTNGRRIGPSGRGESLRRRGWAKSTCRNAVPERHSSQYDYDAPAVRTAEIPQFASLTPVERIISQTCGISDARL